MPHSIYGRKKRRVFAPRPDPAALRHENRLKPVESGAGANADRRRRRLLCLRALPPLAAELNSRLDTSGRDVLHANLNGVQRVKYRVYYAIEQCDAASLMR
jgi:hypothetical protein